MTAVGYKIDQVISLTVYSITTFLFCVQSCSQFQSGATKDRFFTVRWSVHRIGPFSSLFTCLKCVDFYHVYGLYTKQNRLDMFFGDTGAALEAVIAFSCIYSIVLTNSIIARGPVPRWFTITLGILSFIFPVLVNVVVLVGVVDGSEPRDEFVQLWGFITCVMCIIVMALATMRLRSRIGAQLQLLNENSDGVAVSINAMRQLLFAFIGISIVCIALGALSLVFAIQEWGVGHSVADPDVYKASSPLSALFCWIGLVILLWWTWIPISFSKNGRCIRLNFHSSHGSHGSHHSKDKTTKGTGTAEKGHSTPGASRRQGTMHVDSEPVSVNATHDLTSPTNTHAAASSTDSVIEIEPKSASGTVDFSNAPSPTSNAIPASPTDSTAKPAPSFQPMDAISESAVEVSTQDSSPQAGSPSQIDADR